MTPAEFRAARKALGMTQIALAKRLAVAVRTIRRAETKGPTMVETLAMHWLSLFPRPSCQPLREEPPGCQAP